MPGDGRDHDFFYLKSFEDINYTYREGQANRVDQSDWTYVGSKYLQAVFTKADYYYLRLLGYLYPSRYIND